MTVQCPLYETYKENSSSTFLSFIRIFESKFLNFLAVHISFPNLTVVLQRSCTLVTNLTVVWQRSCTLVTNLTVVWQRSCTLVTNLTVVWLRSCTLVTNLTVVWLRAVHSLQILSSNFYIFATFVYL